MNWITNIKKSVMKSYLARHHLNPISNSSTTIYLLFWKSIFIFNSSSNSYYDLLPSICMDVWNVYDSFELNVIRSEINKCVSFHKICPIDFNVCLRVWFVMFLLHFIAYAAWSNYFFVILFQMFKRLVSCQTLNSLIYVMA